MCDNYIDKSIYENNKWISSIFQLKDENLFYERQPIIIRLCQNDKKMYQYITESKEWIDDKKLKHDIKYGRNKKYVIVECFKCGWKIDNDIHKNNNQCINDYCKTATEIKNITNGVINFYITGTITSTALKLFYSLIGEEKFNKFEKVDDQEYKWLEAASLGGLINCEKGYNGLGYEYDVNSHYPSIMQNMLPIPFKNGTYQNITEFPKIIQCGIYRCKISGNINKYLFRLNNDNYYVHTDICTARSLGYNIELINDGSYNALIYNKEDTFSGCSLFYKYVKYLYDLKEKYDKNNYYSLNKVFKLLLNCLWGKLSQSNIIQMKIKVGEDITLRKNECIVSVDFDSVYSILTISKDDRYYAGDLPRIKPFITSYGRYFISNKIKNYVDDCVRLHTDGFILKNKHDELLDIKNAQKFKGMKYKELGNITINHVNNIIIN